MEKRFVLIFALIGIVASCLHIPESHAQAAEKDWTLDPKTSTLIPKYVGKVKVLKGEAFIEDRELKKGSKFYNNELIRTSNKSALVVELIDLSLITLGANSEFKVENWAYRTKNDREATFAVLKGQWRALIKSKSKEDDQLKIKTSLVSMGVRGTELLVNVSNIGDKEINQIALLEGHIHLEGELSKNMKPDLVAGDYALIEKKADGIEQQKKVLTPAEMKSYQELTAPEVYRLLEPVAYNEKADDKTSTVLSSENQKSSVQNTRMITPKSLDENLKILNTTREENLKSK